MYEVVTNQQMYPLHGEAPAPGACPLSGRKHGGCHEEARAQGIQSFFCVGELTEMEKRLYGGGDPGSRWAAHYCTKTEQAGDTLVLTVYPSWAGATGPRRKRRKAMSRERQTRYNRERARRRLALLMDANFRKNDLHVTLTYRGRRRTTSRRGRMCGTTCGGEAHAGEGRTAGDEIHLRHRGRRRGWGERRIHVHLMMTGGVSRKPWRRNGAGVCQLRPAPAGGRDGAARAGAVFHKSKAWRSTGGPERVQEPSAAQNYTVSRTRMSNARCAGCQEMPGSAAEVMGKLYPAYKLGAVEPYERLIPGVYLVIRLWRRCRPWIKKHCSRDGLPFWRW